MTPTAARAAVLVEILRSSRRRHGISQLEIAHRLGVSQRHVSFLELGRTRPSRELLLAWMSEVGAADAECNAALLHAGYRVEPGNGPDAAPPEALARLIEAHEPNMAFVFDGLWRIRLANSAAAWIEGLVMPGARKRPGDLIYALRDSEGLFSRLRDPLPTAATLLRRLREEQLAQPLLKRRIDALEAALVARLGPLPDAPPYELPALDMVFDSEIGVLAFQALQFTAGLPQNVSPNSFRAELWYPADEATAAKMRERPAASR